MGLGWWEGLWVTREQVKHLYRVVSPEEYDEAVQRNPSASLLAATGDHRSGQQLLTDGAFDARRTAAAAAASEVGREELNAMAAAADAMIV